MMTTDTGEEVHLWRSRSCHCRRVKLSQQVLLPWNLSPLTDFKMSSKNRQKKMFSGLNFTLVRNKRGCEVVPCCLFTAMHLQGEHRALMEPTKRALIISEAGWDFCTASSADHTNTITQGEKQSVVFLQPPVCECMWACASLFQWLVSQSKSLSV